MQSKLEKLLAGKATWAEHGQYTESSSGTAWVAPGEGSTWDKLADAFDGRYPARAYQHYSERTNLKLTGAPLTDYDRQRWESGNVE